MPNQSQIIKNDRLCGHCGKSECFHQINGMIPIIRSLICRFVYFRWRWYLSNYLRFIFKFMLLPLHHFLQLNYFLHYPISEFIQLQFRNVFLVTITICLSVCLVGLFILFFIRLTACHLKCILCVTSISCENELLVVWQNQWHCNYTFSGKWIEL